MPQMAPLSWLLLFMVFSLSLITFSIMNYFLIIKTPKTYSKTKTMLPSLMNWKW